MAKYGRIRRFTGGGSPIGGFDPDAAAFFAAVTAAGGTLSPTVKTEWDTTVLALKDGSYYSRFIFISPKLGGVAASAILDATGNLTPVNSNFVNGDAHSIIGLTGDGSTKSIDYGVTQVSVLPNANSWTYAVQFITAPVSGIYSLSSRDGTPTCALRPASPNNLAYGNTLGIVATSSNPATYPQIFIGTRRSSTILRAYTNGTGGTIVTTANATAAPTGNIFEYGLGSGATVAVQDASRHGVSFAIDGLSDADAAAISTIFATFYTNITA